MSVSVLEWLAISTVTIAVFAYDFVVVARRPREPSMRECAITLSVYIGLAGIFAIRVWLFHGQRYAIEFLAGWVTEYSLSVDNLFLFIVVMAAFKVPKVYQQQALLVGIVIALVLRGIFILLGALAIQRFSWVFYIFGGFLVYTAIRLVRDAHRDVDADNPIVEFIRRHLKTADTWDGLKLHVKEGSHRRLTPMLLVVLALAGTDLFCALDSIPAIFGLTREPYLVFAANVFALMGLRQLYFMMAGLLQRLAYLSLGLGVVVLFIGIKLILQALRDNNLPFINGGQQVNVPEIPTPLSLAVIVVTLVVAAAASLYTTRVGDTD
ncbi:MAG: TerC/Alx family metal homeostasis membrane protein, partial [Mycobacterium sp.]|nr:TerC/Alx family metal homeostasis membrane protein [Mycobacterium sp.]